jgi:hypothetical protein
MSDWRATARLRAGAREVYMALRNGKRAETPWEDISAAHQEQIVAAFAAGLAAWKGYQS